MTRKTISSETASVNVGARGAPTAKADAGEGDVLEQQFTREFQAILRHIKDARGASAGLSADGDVDAETAAVAHYGAISQRLIAVVNHLLHRTKELVLRKKESILLAFGDKFAEIHEFQAARKFFYEQILFLRKDPRSTENTAKPSNEVFVRAMFGAALCRFHAAKYGDPFVRLPGTLEALLASLRMVQSGMEIAMGMERMTPHQFAWLLLNGSVLVYSIAKPLATLGFKREVVPFFKWCLLCLESTVVLSTTKYILWRLQIYTVVCECLESVAAKRPKKAAAYLQALVQCADHAQAVVARLRREEELDLPLPKQITATLQNAETIVEMLVARSRVRGKSEPFGRKALEGVADSSTRLRLALDCLDKASNATKNDAIVNDVFSLTMELVEPRMRTTSDTSSDEVTQDIRHQLDREFPIPYHMVMLRTAYNLARVADMASLLQVARHRLRAGKENEDLVLELELLEALRKLDAHPDQETDQGAKNSEDQHLDVAKALKAWVVNSSEAVSLATRDFIASVCLQLWKESTRDTVRSLDEQPPTENGYDQASKVQVCAYLLEVIYLSLTKIDFDDKIMMAEVCFRLCLLLHMLSHRRKAIRFVRDGLARISSLRDQVAHSSSHFESLSSTMRKSLSASTFSCDVPPERATSDCEGSDEDTVTARRNVGVVGTGSQFGAQYQELTCIEVDLLLLLFKLEMDDAKVMDAIDSSTESTTSMAVRKLSASSTVENALRKEFKKNSYALALLNAQKIRLAEGGANAKECTEWAAESMTLIRKAEIQERELLKTIDAITMDDQESITPRAPRILTRCSTSITVEIAPFKASSAAARRRQIAFYMVFAKPSGAGTDVSLNNAEYPGTADPVDPMGPLVVTISSLAPNVSYVFAAAAFDTNGEVIQGIGETSKPVVALNPLPIVSCYGYLAQACYEAKLLDAARKAARQVYEAAVSTEQSTRPGWASNFFYRHALRRSVIARWPIPLLSLVIQSVFVLCHTEEGDAQRDGQLVSVDGAILASRQVAVMEASRMIAVGVEVATATADLEQIRVLCFKGYRILLPLLHLDDANALNFGALATFYQALRCIPLSMWDTDTRGITARIAFELVRITWHHRHLADAVYLQIRQFKEAAGSFGSDAVPGEMQSLLDAIAIAECSLGRSLTGSTETSRPTTAASAQAKGATKTPTLAAPSASPQATPRPTDESTLPSLSELIEQSKLAPRDAFKLLEPHFKSSCTGLEVFCKLCECVLDRSDESVVEEWIGLVKLKGNIGPQFKESIRSAGLDHLLPAPEETAAPPPTSAPSTARAAATTSRAPEPAAVAEAPLQTPTPEPKYGEDDEYLSIWCAELCLIQAKLLYRALHRKRSTSPPTADCTNGPQFDLAFETRQLGDINESPAQPSESQPAEVVETNQPLENHDSDLFHRFMGRVAAACRLFVRARAWQGLQTAAQLATNAIWVEWVSPTTVGDSLDSLTACTEAIVAMIEVVTIAVQEQQGVPVTQPPGDTSAVEFRPSIPFASTTVVTSAMSTVNSDQTWISNLVSFTLQALLFHKRWHKMVEIGKKYHLLSGGSLRFSEKMLPVLVYAQQQYVEEQKTRLGNAQQSLDAFVKSFMDAETKKKKKKSRLVVEEVLTPEEIEFRKERDEREAEIRELSHEHSIRQAELDSLQQMHSAVSRTINKAVLAFDSCHELVEKHRRQGESVVKPQQIVTAYVQCVVIGRQKRQRRLVGKALQELGDFLMAHEDRKGAIKYWNEAIDNAFNALRVTTTWREVLHTSEPEVTASDPLTEGEGLWVCLESCMAMMKLILIDDGTSSIGASSTELARMAAAVLTRILTKCSLPHPSLSFMYGAYQAASQLWPGRELLMDGERLDATSLGTMFVVVSQVLLQYEHPVEAMPLITAYEHLAMRCFEDVNHVANARRARVDALGACGRFHEAFEVLASILGGVVIERTPKPREASAFLDKLAFNPAKPIKDSSNAAFLAWLATVDVSKMYADLVTMYSPETSRRMLLSIAALLLRLTEHEPIEEEMNAPVRQHASRFAASLEGLLQQQLEQLDSSGDIAVSRWERLTVQFLVAEANLVHAQVAFTGGQWMRARKLSDEAIDAVAKATAFLDHEAAGTSPHNPAILSLDQLVPGAFIHRPSTVAIRARIVTVQCKLAQQSFQEALEEITHAIDEAHRAGEQLHFVRHLELLRAQAVAMLGSSAMALEDLLSLREDFVKSHSCNSLEFVRLLRMTATLLQDRGTANATEASTNDLKRVLDLLGEAEAAMDGLLRRDGWISTNGAASDDKRMNLYHPGVPLFVKLKAELARCLVQVPCDGAVEVHVRELQALEAIDVALKAIDHTVASLTPTKAHLLVMRGAILKKRLVKPGTRSDAMLNECVLALVSGAQEAIRADGGHNRVLLRSALVELVDVFGAKLVSGQEAEHVQAAFHYLNLALIVQSLQQTLVDSLDLQGGTLTNADKLPSFLVDAILGESSANLAVPPLPVQAIPAKGGSQPPTDATKRPVIDAQRLINFFIRVVRDAEALPACASLEQAVVVYLHGYLLQNHSGYAKVCCLSSIPPVPTADPEIKAGLISAHWQRDLTPALTENAVPGTVTLFFTLGTTLLSPDTHTRPGTGDGAAEDGTNAAMTLRAERFVTSPVLSRRTNIVERKVAKLRQKISNLRIHMEEEDSLVIDKSSFPLSFHDLLQSIQLLFRPREPRPLESSEADAVTPADSNESSIVLDRFGQPVPLVCSLELVKTLEAMFDVDRGANSALDNHLCYFLRDLLDN